MLGPVNAPCPEKWQLGQLPTFNEHRLWTSHCVKYFITCSVLSYLTLPPTNNALCNSYPYPHFTREETGLRS